jgi:hypothetical protein
VGDRLGYYLRNPYFIQVYNSETQQFIKLNQNELTHGYNPFKLNSSINTADSESIFDVVELHVIEDSSVYSEASTASSIYQFQYTLTKKNYFFSDISRPETILLEHNYASKSVGDEQESQQGSILPSSIVK